MKSTDTTHEASVNTEPVVSEVAHVVEPVEGAESPEDLATAATELNITEDMDGDAKKAQSYAHNRRVNNYGKCSTLLFYSRLSLHSKNLSSAKTFKSILSIAYNTGHND